MLRLTCLGLGMAVLVSPAAADDKPAKKKESTVEVRWAEDKAVKGVTDEKGVDLSCTDAKAYLHTTPLLTRADLAGCKAKQAGGDGGFGGGKAPYLVTIQVTKDAAKKLATSSRENKDKPMVLLLEGKIIAAMVVKTELADAVVFLPSFTADGLKAFTELVGEK